MCSQPEKGIWRGRSIAKVYTSATGMTVLVGRSAADNDTLTLKLARSRDFWFHAAAHSGAHVVVLNPANVDRLDRTTLDLAASLAARHSSGRGGGLVAVHYSRRSDVGKPRGLASGKVSVRRHRVVHARPYQAPEVDEDEQG